MINTQNSLYWIGGLIVNSYWNAETGEAFNFKYLM